MLALIVALSVAAISGLGTMVAGVFAKLATALPTG